MSLLKRAEKSGNKFLNPVPTTMAGAKMMLEVLPLYLRNRAETEPKTTLGPFRTDPGIYSSAPGSGLRITWFGHSGMLLEIDGVRVQIDPVWERRASPVSWMGPKRFFPPTLPLEDLPALDAVLLSHDHYDHLGVTTIRRLARLPSASRAKWVAPLGVGPRLRRLGVPGDRIVELDWTQSTEIPGAEPAGGVRVDAWPARHFSGRTPLDRFTTLWSCYVLEGPRHRVYYGGDSGLWDGFGEVAARYGPFDMSMLEIGAFHPLWASIHLGPDGAAEAYRQMGGPEHAGVLFPIHWGLFNLALHGWREPIERLTTVAAAEGWPLWLPVPGRPTEVRANEPLDSRWWEVAR